MLLYQVQSIIYGTRFCVLPDMSTSICDPCGEMLKQLVPCFKTVSSLSWKGVEKACRKIGLSMRNKHKITQNQSKILTVII